MNKLVLIVLILGVISIGYYFLGKTSNQASLPTPSSNPSVIENKTYTSDFLKIKFSVPKDFSIEEKFGNIKIQNQDKIVEIDRNGTNFDNLYDYLNDLNKKNHTEIDDKIETKIDEKESIVGNINNKKTYFIYSDNWVYIIWTDNKDTYDLVDQVAESLEFIP